VEYADKGFRNSKALGGCVKGWKKSGYLLQEQGGGEPPNILTDNLDSPGSILEFASRNMQTHLPSKLMILSLSDVFQLAYSEPCSLTCR